MQAPDTLFMRLRQYTHFCIGWGSGLPARPERDLPERGGGSHLNPNCHFSGLLPDHVHTLPAAQSWVLVQHHRV